MLYNVFFIILKVGKNGERILYLMYYKFDAYFLDFPIVDNFIQSWENDYSEILV